MRGVALLLLLGPSLVLAHAGLEADVARLTKALEESPTAALHLRRAAKLRLWQRYDDALADVERARARGAPAVEVAQEKGLTLAAKGDAKAALAELDRFLALGGVSVDALNARAGALVALGRGDEAVLDLTRSAALFPEPDVFLRLARVQERLARPADAAATLEKGLSRLGGAVTLRLELIALYRRTKQHGLALAQARAAAAAVKVKTQWQLLAAEILLEQRRTREARAELTAAVADLDRALAARPNPLQREARDRALTLLKQTRPRQEATP